MDLKGILAISGQSGLYKLISKVKNSVIVESLDDKKRIPVYSSNNINPLEEIAVFTSEEEIHLKDIFKNIYTKENGGISISPKSSPEELKKYLEAVVPNYDKEKVYVSDIKKIINWYNQLHKHNLLVFDDEKEEEVVAKETKQVEEKQTVE